MLIVHRISERMLVTEYSLSLGWIQVITIDSM